jgi:hypothetical protein
MVRAAPETVAQVITDTRTRGMWDAQFSIANVVDQGGSWMTDGAASSTKHGGGRDGGGVVEMVV